MLLWLPTIWRDICTVITEKKSLSCWMPLQEAYVNGYWKELVSFTRNLFNNTFKTNPYLERAVMTGVTNIVGMKFATQTSNGSALAETIFSDLNNLNVVAMTSKEYSSCFGFTEDEVLTAMNEFGLTNKDDVKQWYDGFRIGKLRDVYNPWSIICFLDKKQLKPYWTKSSSNGLASSLICEGNRTIKMQFELLLFVLGLLVDLAGRYVVTSNRESGSGRYDVILQPLNQEDEI